jgi:hypothetical protein
MTTPKTAKAKASKPVATKKPRAAKAVVPPVPLSPLFRDLPSFFVIDGAMFAKQTPVQQTELIASAVGKNVRFVPSFATLRDKNSLRDRLLNGTDVTLEIEFNELDISADEQATLAKVRPILDRLMGTLKNSYQWKTPYTGNEVAFRVGGEEIRHNGYSVSKAFAEKLWKRASKYWAQCDLYPTDRVRDPKPGHEPIGGGYGYQVVGVTKTGVLIGCQSISRAKVEFIARHYGWEPNVPE